MDLIEHVSSSLEKANAGHSRLPAEIYTPGLHRDGYLQGMSTAKVRHFLNNLCSMPDTRYFEVGTYLGSTLISAAYGNPGVFAAVDTFQWNGGQVENGNGVSIRSALHYNLERFGVADKITFIEGNCWSIDQKKLPAPFNIYFYDGSHSWEEQRLAVTHFAPLMSDPFVLVVDDWRENESNKVPSGTYRGISDAGLEIVFETEAPSGDYHLGLGIFVLKRR